MREVGTARNLALQAPSVVGDERFRPLVGALRATGGEPERVPRARPDPDRSGRAQRPSRDPRPTLVLQRAEDSIVSAEQDGTSREHIDGARFVLLPGIDHVPFIGDADAILDEAEEFVTGARPAPEAHRVLATVLFTDIVDSTEIQASRGDAGWRRSCNVTMPPCARLARFGGEEQDTAGDGFYARFDGPARAIRCATEIVDEVRADRDRGPRRYPHGRMRARSKGKCSGLSVSIGARAPPRRMPLRSSCRRR